MKTKRQKLKEKKRRQKEKKKEAAPRQELLLVDEVERERVWILDSLKPSPEAVDQAIAGHPGTHPQLLRLLVTADSFSSTFCAQAGISPTLFRPVLRRLVLSSSPFTHEAFAAAVFPSTPGDPITPLPPLHHADDNLVMNNNADYHGPPLPPTTCTHSPLTAALSSTTPPPPDSLPSTHCSPCSD